MTPPICENCRYFARYGEVDGNCNRYPTPIVKKVGQWCGEYKNKAEKRGRPKNVVPRKSLC